MTVGLVLEGGGMRGVYTAGVLEYFLRRELRFPYVVGVSAGACNACSYISRQPGRNRQVTIGYVGDSRYLSVRNLFRERSMFGMKFIFDEIPKNLVPFDYDAFYQAPERFVVGATDAHTGEPVYEEKRAGIDLMPFVQASSSLPFASVPVQRDGRVLFDGGISDPIPLAKSAADGNRKHVVVLTRPEGYLKKPFRFERLARMKYPRYPGLVLALVNRYRLYNDTLAEVERMERKGSAFVFRPSTAMPIGRMEKKPDRLEALYQLGSRDAEQQYAALSEWLGR